MGLTDDKIRSLRRMRLVATGCLGVALVGYLTTGFWPRDGVVGWVRAFFEAALVGGLADWFAVVALFRHPLGIPIPHTAVLKRGKDRIGGALGEFVVTNFMNRRVLHSRLKEHDFAGGAGAWLAANCSNVAEKICAILPRFFSALDDASVERFIREQFEGQVRRVNLAKVAGDSLSVLTADGRDQVLLQHGIDLAGRLIEENRDLICRKIREELPLADFQFEEVLGPMGKLLDRPFEQIKDRMAEVIADKVVEKVRKTLRETGADPEHELRARFRARIEALVADLRESHDMRERGERIRDQLLDSPALAEYASGMWGRIKDMILEDVSRPGSKIRGQIEESLRRAATGLDADEELRGKINAWLLDGLLDFAERHGPQARAAIERTVAEWDAEEMTSKLELEVGRDLQFVRLNGTLVGGLIGLALHALGVLGIICVGQ